MLTYLKEGSLSDFPNYSFNSNSYSINRKLTLEGMDSSRPLVRG